MSFFFILLAVLLIISALGVVCLRDPVYGALSLIVHMTGIAAAFIALDAHFLAMAQIIVYAGAVVVLFLFVIMLLNVKREQIDGKTLLYAGTASLLAVLLAIVLIPGVHSELLQLRPGSLFRLGSADFGTAKEVGKVLFNKYLFLFELASVLIMAALAGAVMLARRLRAQQQGGEGK